ncbi:MAG: PQQ-like beta-propeller repeat protein [Acidobacteriota bacterium]|nr:PQQ-like beta-propeller repeat protein [Acidobacteriota bacterium]
MTSKPQHSRTCAACLLALFVSLNAPPTRAQKPAATKTQAAQKQSDAQKKAAAQKKPAAAKPQTGAAKPNSTPQTQPRQVAPAAQARELGPSILIRWQGRPGVERYRLQLATDEAFTDIVFDQAVQGRQYVVKGLPPGNYFWRVAAAAAETSAAYSRPERVTLTETGERVEPSSVVLPADTAGWRTATGEVVRLVPAPLRTGQVFDFVGVGADGRVFAVDGASGISLWTARFSTAAMPPGTPPAGRENSLAPLVVTTAQKATDVVVATQGGVRALRGETGREDWRASLEGRITGGVAADIDGDGSTEVVIITADPSRLYVLNGSSGRRLAEQKLDGDAVGAPYPLAAGSARGVLLGMKKGRVEFRGADGNLVSEGKVEGEVTTAPVVVTRGAMSFIAVGTDNGLWAFNVPDLKTLGVIKAEDDSVRGTLAVADVDGDGAPEIVMVTKRGRVALVNTTDGNVRWSTEGATDAASAAFADVNADGVLDVIVPGGKDFALAFSGRDGSLVMKIEEGGKQSAVQKEGAALRSLVVTPSPGGGMMLVGGDPAGVGLRAVELPKGANKAASK